jgi:hypothetical protein
MKQSILRMIITCALCTAFSMSVYAGDYCMKQKGHHKTKAENCKPACSKKQRCCKNVWYGGMKSKVFKCYYKKSKVTGGA